MATTLAVPHCPTCGSERVGTVEVLTGLALVDSIGPDGEPEYSGNTEVDWDESETVTTDEGGPLYRCHGCGEEGGWRLFVPEGERDA